MEDIKSAIRDSLPDDVTPESLPENTQDVTPAPSPEAPVETPTPKVEQKEPPFHEHPRWKEILSDRDYWKQVAMEAVEKAKQPVQPMQDPYAGKTPEEKAFWEEARRVAREEARKEREEAEKIFGRELQQNKAVVTNLLYERFQQKHPDIKPGSEEESAIAARIRQGYLPEDAYNLVTAARRIKEAEERAAAKYRQEMENKNKKKLAANLEGPSVATGSPIEPAKKKTTRDFVEEFFKAQQAGV